MGIQHCSGCVSHILNQLLDGVKVALLDVRAVHVRHKTRDRIKEARCR